MGSTPMLSRQWKRPGVDDRWGSWCGLSWRSVRVRVLGFEPVVSFRSVHIGHGERASPAPSPRWGGAEKANCGSSEPWNRRGGGGFDPRHPRVWECASRRGSQTGSPHGVGKPPVLFAPHGAAPHPFASRRPDVTRSPHRVPPLRLSPASWRSRVLSVYCEFRVGTGRSQVGSPCACRGTGLPRESRGLALAMPAG